MMVHRARVVAQRDSTLFLKVVLGGVSGANSLRASGTSCGVLRINAAPEHYKEGY